MRQELKPLWDAISRAELPADPIELFGDGWDEAEQHFRLQETYLIDFKDHAPDNFSEGMGSGIVRLALGFHNSFGGIVVFGVNDRSLTLSGLQPVLDVERFNRMLSDVTGAALECIFKTYKLPGAHSEVGVLLVPRRGIARPLALRRELGSYRAGMIWLRERHEVLEATPSHLPHLYSSRQSLTTGGDEPQNLPIHRSLPPSPATMHSFIGRDELIRELWDWFVFGDQPRMYLHGPGGSGKSTLAFEFAKTIADIGFNVVAESGERIDYVLFLSAKETELNPLTGEQQIFTLRQFDNSETEFKQILFHSGHFDSDAIEAANDDQIEIMLTDLFSSYAGLLVLDDIDALSRREEDTGEETLLLKAIGGGTKSKRTRILYTLRYRPAHARRNAFEVPGLSGKEFYDFLDACCIQFDVPPPQAEIIPLIEEETQSLPLLLETLIGLRRCCGTFQEALALFKDKGGDAARSYLYQREYDALDHKGKSREIMATLALLEEPIQFSTIVNLLNFNAQRVSDALSECGSIFLSTAESEFGETLYQLTPPSRPFVRSVSQRLDRFHQIERRAQLLRRQGSSHTPAEAAIIVRMRALLRADDIEGVILFAESLPSHDPSLANPMVLALLGQAYATAGGDKLEKARECFRQSSALGNRDSAMMRKWYYLESRSGYGLDEAKRVCSIMLDSPHVGGRARSEFLSKLAFCYLQEAQALMSVSREKSVPLFHKAIETYLDAERIAHANTGMDPTETLNWLQRAVLAFLRYLRDDLAEFLPVLDALAARKQDISLEAAQLLTGAMQQAHISSDVRIRAKLAGLSRRTAGRLERATKGDPKFPGINHVADMLIRTANALTA